MEPCDPCQRLREQNSLLRQLLAEAVDESGGQKFFTIEEKKSVDVIQLSVNSWKATTSKPGSR